MGCGASVQKPVLPYPRATTEYGEIEGRRYIIKNRKPVNVFLGVPFAKPPLGELRFKKPVPPDPWDTCLLCKRYKCRPTQPNFPWDVQRTLRTTSEDCLYLNIFAPAWESSEFPVCFAVKNIFNYRTATQYFFTFMAEDM